MKQILVGLNVVENAEYAVYRKKMTPILERYGGGFRYDFSVSETLRSETDKKINRIFIIYFPDAETQKLFFEDSDYLAVKNEHFEASVSSTTIIAEFEEP
jgi:uncharacterized protein (DUF1330 family)